MNFTSNEWNYQNNDIDYSFYVDHNRLADDLKNMRIFFLNFFLEQLMRMTIFVFAEQTNTKGEND